MTTAGGPDDGGLFGAPRRDGPRPPLVVVGIAWAAFGVVALITAVLMRSVGIAVFGAIAVVAGGGMYWFQQTRDRLEADERSWRADPGGFLADGPPDLGPEDVDPDAGAPADPDGHATRVMSTGGHDDDIVDAEYTEYREPSLSEQDDGTGYDDEERAFQHQRQQEWEHELRTRHDGPQVIEADDEDDGSRGSEGHDDGHDRDPDAAHDRADEPGRDHGRTQDSPR